MTQTKHSQIRDDYPTTMENAYRYMEMLHKMPKRDLIIWVSVRQGYTLREVAAKILPEWGYDPVNPTTIRYSLLKTHEKLAKILG
jgi:hypothetical protein